MWRQLGICLFVVTLSGSPLSGCASGRPASSSAFPGDTHFGSRGAPPGWHQSGIASYYGPGFHGRRTANGERFDMYRVSAAHRTLPFGTWVRVTRKDTGRSIRVRINDRGPFVPGRIIDLSLGAARSLEMEEEGVVPVEIVVVGAE
jgi:rare lipoprotein A